MTTQDGRVRLAAGVAIRAERFGGLIYRYDNRRLYFIHSRIAADFLLGLDDSSSLVDAAHAFVQSQGLTAEQVKPLLDSVAQLERMGLLVRDTDPSAGPASPLASVPTSPSTGLTHR
ncbi:MAG: mycofactocin biosynthesis chaperone MftB [Rhodospirillales bacterium]|nr:mycofactocin biosynthesis chaperone MftB [Rhodospirillales bacterium]